MKSTLAVFTVSMIVLMCFTSINSAYNLNVAFGQSSFQFVTGTDSYTPKTSSIPQKGVTLIDPNFHTSIVRITDKSDGYSDDGIENEYARANPENSDGTKVILRSNDAEYYLYDAVTYQILQHFTDIAGGVEPEPRWDATDPKTFYYVYGTELRAFNINSNVSTVIHDFKKEFPSAAYITTKVEGDASLDRRFWSFMVEDSSYDVMSVIVYDKTSNNIIGQKSVFPDSLNWVSMDMSGKHCVVGYDNNVAQVFSTDFKTTVNLPEGANGHMDLAFTSDGKDVMVYQNTVTDWIAMADLATGVETRLLKIPFDVTEDIGMHFSGNCADTPGWVLISTYGSKNAPLNENHSWMDTQLFMVQLKANPSIWRIAHTNAYTSLNYNAEKNYFAESFASINTEGTKIYFGSNWGSFTGGDYTDTYQVTLPKSWVNIIPKSNNTTPQSPTTSGSTPTPEPTITPEFPALLVTLPIIFATLMATIFYKLICTKKKR